MVHKTLTKGNIVAVALDREALGYAEPHIPLLSWCFRNHAYVALQHVGYIAQTGIPSFVHELELRFPEDRFTILVGLAAGGHEELALALLDDPSTLAVAREVFGTTARALSDGGFIRAARLVESNVSRWRPFPVLAAVERGHLAFVQWALDGYRWSEHDNHMMYAAGSGNVELLEWLLSQGCPLDPEAPQFAAAHGHIHVLEWLNEHGLPVNDHCLALAVTGGHLDTISWLVDNGCPLSGTLLADTLMHRAARHQQPQVVELLIDLGCPYSELVVTLDSCSNVYGDGLFRWLMDRGFECDAIACLSAATANLRFDVVHICERFDIPLPVSYLSSAVAAKDMDRLRRALDAGMYATLSDVTLLVRDRQCALLDEVLRRGHVPDFLGPCSKVARPYPAMCALFVKYGYAQDEGSAQVDAQPAQAPASSAIVM